MIGFGADLHAREFARRKEFLLTAGDAYCSSSLAGNTRKYHGLFVAGRRVYLSCLEEHANDERISVHSYAGALQDEGLRSLYGFELYPPRFYYMVDGASIKKAIEFDGELTIRYDVEGEANLRIRPLITDRGYHETKRNIELKAVCTENGFSSGKLSMRSCLPFIEDPRAYYDVLYERDRERGYDHVEDLWSPGFFEGRVKDASTFICAAVNGIPKATHEGMAPADIPGCLELAADSFIVDDAIYAGYHWFAEPWGRDTFVSVPGLLLERGKFDGAKRVFRHFGKQIKGGLMPNRIPGGYNSSDAPLWFIYALGKYFEKRDDRDFLHEAKGYVESILEGYPESEAARLDGALVSSAPETTWMDTRYTVRKGKAVEVNALWISALEIAEGMGLPAPVKPALHGASSRGSGTRKKGACMTSSTLMTILSGLTRPSPSRSAQSMGIKRKGP